MTVRVLAAHDVPELEAFLLEHADSSLFLRANLLASGIVDRDAPYHGTYAAAFDDDRMVAVAAQYWNGNVIVQAPRSVEDVVRTATVSTRRPVRAILGPWTQVEGARAALGLGDARVRLSSRERLMALELDRVVIPEALAAGRLVCRPTCDEDLELVTAWRVAYYAEELARPDGPEVRLAAREDIGLLHAGGAAWVLEHRGALVSFSAFNARLPDVVQIGGVFTPPALRRLGYGRAVVAGSLVAARATGVTRAVLFTGEENPAAQRAYAAIGFRTIGDYGIVYV